MCVCVCVYVSLPKLGQLKDSFRKIDIVDGKYSVICTWVH